VVGYPNDLAVIAFDDVTANINVQWSPLAQPSDGTFAGANCQLAGWGRMELGANLPANLQYGEVAAQTVSECIAVWGTQRIFQSQLCTISPTVSVCTGDNGGPLFCGDKLAGISSWGDSQCSVTNPAVFSRVSFYISWILQQ
jgi:secreted trypsin-like serine protease